MLNPEHYIGRTFPPTPPYEVSRAKLDEFVAALDDDNPAFQGDNPVAPPTFAAVVASLAWNQMFEDPELDLELRRVIHTRQDFTWNRMLRVGDVVTAQVTIEDIKLRSSIAGMREFVSIAVTLSTLEGEEIGVSRSTLIHTRPVDETMVDEEGKQMDARTLVQRHRAGDTLPPQAKTETEKEEVA